MIPEGALEALVDAHVALMANDGDACVGCTFEAAIEPWWAAMEAMVQLAAEGGLPNDLDSPL